MSKRLQITLTDEGYEKLFKLCNNTGSSKGWPKSTIIELSIYEMYRQVDNRNGWKDWDHLTSEIK